MLFVISGPAASTSAMEAKCGGADRFCPYGSALPTPVDIGYYTVGHLSIPGSYQNNVDKLVRVAQVICEPGTYCIDGTKYPWWVKLFFACVDDFPH